jgi:hypothetical protein
MAELEDFQFDLDGYVWGRGRPVFVEGEGFDTGDAEKIKQQSVNPLTGERRFGRDVQGAETWTWACFLDSASDTPETALASVAEMGRVWRDEKWNQTGVVAALRYKVAGRTRVVFGRPDRFSFRPGNSILHGNLPPLATFEKVDAKHYEDAEETLDLHLVPQVAGGFEAPFAAPLSVARDPAAGTPGAVVIGGDAKTGCVVTFEGPSTDPSVTIGDFFLGVTGSIPEGASVTLDSRPWATTLTKVGPVGNISLTRGTRLARALLAPGTYQAVYRAQDTSGESSCRVAWRNAWHTL